MKKKIYLLAAIILIVSIICSFAMAAGATDGDETVSSESASEVTAPSSDESESSTAEEPEDTTKTRPKWKDMSEEEKEEMIRGLIDKAPDEIKTYLRERVDISDEDIAKVQNLVANWKEIGQSLISTTKPTTTKPTTTKKAVTTTKKSSNKGISALRKQTVATTLSEAEITTLGLEEEVQENVASLKNEGYGVAVYPDRSGGYSFTNGSVLTVLDVDEASMEFAALLEASGVAAEDFIFLKDISVSNYDGQKVKIAFTVGEKYKGQIVTVLHYHNSEVETFLTKVSEDGLVVIAVDGLSPFAIMLGQPEVTVKSAGVFGKLSDLTGLSNLAIILILCAIVVLAAIIVVVVVINNDRKKKWAEAHQNLE